MKKLFTLILSVFALVMLANTASFAQATANANSTATIITPIAISNSAQLSFGNIAATATSGTVTLAASATPTRTVTGGVTLPSFATGSPSAAIFGVTGSSGYTFSSTVNGGPVTLSDGNSHTMTFTPSISGATGTLTGGNATVYVGGVLSVGASQAAATYTNTGGITVTVNYN